MRDRVSQNPNRWEVEYPDGRKEFVKLRRADSPVDEGTLLNKANLLSDATATLLGLAGDPTVNDALARFGTFVSGGGLVEFITASKTWKAPFNCTVFVLCVGAGGGGGGGGGGSTKSSGDSGGIGSGGGSGYYASGVFNFSKGTSVTATIGVGGTGGTGGSAGSTASDTKGTSGATGGTTSFGTYISAPGGGGGKEAGVGLDGNLSGEGPLTWLSAPRTQRSGMPSIPFIKGGSQGSAPSTTGSPRNGGNGDAGSFGAGGGGGYGGDHYRGTGLSAGNGGAGGKGGNGFILLICLPT